MCGIAGKVSFKKGSVSKEALRMMTRAIAHRGPDDEGTYVSSDNQVGLGHRRLSIIDLSPLGHQPMSYLNRYWIVFNGEIYNFQTKRDELLALGYKFKSKSDTEVILALYDKYKEKCLGHLRGMFAFAIYDQQERILFCARDRVGKKPFKYYIDDSVFLFGSELKAILTQKEYQRQPDYLAIHHYLTLQYVPAPRTGFNKIQKLEPAHYLILNLKTRQLVKKRYWQLDYRHTQELSEAAWSSQIITKLEEAVKLRMVADVPLGAFLSGGVDSSAIVGLMSKLSSQPIKTFSIGFQEEKFNELPYARQIAQKFGTDHTEFVVKPDAMEVLPMLVAHYEEPYADSSAVPTYQVSRLTREHVTVALNGDGGDENFAGYSRYSIQKFSLLAEKVAPYAVPFAVPATRLLAKTAKNSFTERSHRFLRTLTHSYPERYVSYTSFFTDEQKDELYTDTMRLKSKHNPTYALIAKSFQEAQTDDRLDQTLYTDFVTYLPDDLLAKVDIATMAVGLEGRSPFLDHEFLEMTAKIPHKLKIKGFDNKKYILKKALTGFLPDEVMHRPKRGFSIPIQQWFRYELRDYAHDLLLSERARNRGLFDARAVERLLSDHAKTTINYGNHIWALLTLELWFRHYFDGTKP